MNDVPSLASGSAEPRKLILEPPPVDWSLAKGVFDYVIDDLADWHVVALVGPTKSGKTTLVGSLIDFLEMRRGDDPSTGQIRIEPGVLFTNLQKGAGQAVNPLKGRMAEAGKSAYDKILKTFHLGENVIGTQSDWPYFIPIKLTYITGDVAVEAKIVFLEAMGEWFGKDEEVAPSKGEAVRFRNFPEPIELLLGKLRQPISVLFLHPMGVDESDDTFSRLNGCIKDYFSLRQDRIVEKGNASSPTIAEPIGKGDNLLFVLTKWDTVCPPDNTARHFSYVSAETAMDMVKRRGNKGIMKNFELFSSEKMAVYDGNKALLPFAGALFDESGKILNNSEHRLTTDRYIKITWNFIFRNHQKQHRSSLPNVLFSDVEPEFLAASSQLIVVAKTLLLARR